MRLHNLVVELTPDGPVIADVYTESDGRRLPPPILSDDPLPTIAPHLKGLNDLIDDLNNQTEGD